MSKRFFHPSKNNYFDIYKIMEASEITGKIEKQLTFAQNSKNCFIIHAL